VGTYIKRTCCSAAPICGACFIDLILIAFNGDDKPESLP